MPHHFAKSCFMAPPLLADAKCRNVSCVHILAWRGADGVGRSARLTGRTQRVGRGAEERGAERAVRHADETEPSWGDPSGEGHASGAGAGGDRGVSQVRHTELASFALIGC